MSVVAISSRGIKVLSITVVALLFSGICFIVIGMLSNTPKMNNHRNAITNAVVLSKAKSEDKMQSDDKKNVNNSLSAPVILSRAEWKAKKPTGTMKTQKVSLITIHHTATKQQSKITIERKMRGLQDFSQRATTLAGGKKKPAWADVPYHYYINVDGQIAEGRSIEYAGDTNTEYNPTGHALIVLEGNFETEKPTSKQLKSLNDLTLWLMIKYSVKVDAVKSHKDYASTACPGKNLYKLLPIIRKEMSDEMKEKVSNGKK